GPRLRESLRRTSFELYEVLEVLEVLEVPAAREVLTGLKACTTCAVRMSRRSVPPETNQARRLPERCPGVFSRRAPRTAARRLYTTSPAPRETTRRRCGRRRSRRATASPDFDRRACRNEERRGDP